MNISSPSGSAGSRGFAIPLPWDNDGEASRSFYAALRLAETPTLVCDYDGTLAPFHVDKMQARPYPGIAETLERLANSRTRLAFVSGRPVEELMTLLPLAASVEVWGMHGREHRTPDGRRTLLQPLPAQHRALQQAGQQLEAEGFGDLLERKAASVAVHWRSLADFSQQERREHAQRRALEVFTPFAGQHALGLLQFDGGLELRAEDHTKAHATQALLEGFEPRAAAYLGDDTTDEDAFQAIHALGGLSILVREPARQSCAAFSLRPPEKLLAFLEDWLLALAGPRET